jgi:23S rRNA pseudouridine1911/1915/1917 synthase
MGGEVRDDYSVIPAARPDIRVTVPDDFAGLRLDQALARLLPEFSRSRLARWVRDHQVRIDGETALPSERLRGGETIDVAPEADARALADQPQKMPLEIIYEDETLLVINKPPGLVVHPGSGNWSGTLLNALLSHVPHSASLPRAGIVHRLDKDTSGLLVVAKSLSAHTDLVRQLQSRSVARIYIALVHGSVTCDGKVDAPIGRHPVHRTRMAVVPRGKPAITHYEVLRRFAGASLLRCRLETGRTHQIRVHLASIGHPLVGDPVYGARRGARLSSYCAFARQALHAEQLTLLHPRTHRKRTWRAPLPQDFQRLLDELGAAA